MPGVWFRTGFSQAWVHQQGLGDSWNLFLENRYSPRIASFGIYGIGSDQMGYPGLIRTYGHQVLAGIQLIP